MPENEFAIRVPDIEAAAMLKALSELDMRSMGMETAFLIRQEYARRFSKPNPGITIAEAEAAVQE